MMSRGAIRIQQDWNNIMSQPTEANEVWAESSDQFATLQAAEALKLMVGPRNNSVGILSTIPRVIHGGSMLFTVRNSKHEVAFLGQKDSMRLTSFYNSQLQSAMRFVPSERTICMSPTCDACCWCACTDTCSNQYTIEAPTGIKIGHIKQGFGCCFHNYTIRDESDEPVYKFKKWNCCSCCCEDSSVDISDVRDGNDAAVIQNCSRYNAELNFKKQLDGKSKALLLGAMFVIYTFFYNPIDSHKRVATQNTLDSMMVDNRLMLTGGAAPNLGMMAARNQIAPQ